MRVAIACPGPSLSETWKGRDDFDVVIAVNQAAALVEPDWVVAYDSSNHPGTKSTLNVNAPFARVGICSHAGNLTHEPWPDLEKLSIKDITPRELWNFVHTFSALGAMQLAAHLGAREVVMFGDDKSGRRYHDGTQCHSGGDERWKRESLMAEAIRDWHSSIRWEHARPEAPAPIVYAYATPDYSGHLADLARTAAEHGVEAMLDLVPCRGSWQANTAMKPEMIRNAMRREPSRPIVYVDADARIRGPLDLFRDLPCDFAAHWLRGEELLSGTLYFAPTARARKLVDSWIDECRERPRQWDQRSLHAAIHTIPGLSTGDLPFSHVRIFDYNSSEAPVIEHLQASRQFRNRIGVAS